MNITNITSVDKDGKNWIVHTGTCNGTPTKWITQSKWDGEIDVQVVDGNVKYCDSNGDEILVYEPDEIEWYTWDFSDRFNITDICTIGGKVHFQDEKTRNAATEYRGMSVENLDKSLKDISIGEKIVINKICMLRGKYFIQCDTGKYRIPETRQAIIGKLMDMIMIKQGETGRKFFPVNVKHDTRYKWILKLKSKARYM